MKHRNINPTGILLLIVVVALPILFFIDRHHRDSREDLEVVRQRIEILQHQLDSLELNYRQLLIRTRQKEKAILESIDKMTENWTDRKNGLHDAVRKTEEMRLHAAQLQDLLAKQQHYLHSFYEGHRQILLDHQRTLREIQSPAVPAPL